jgi:5S rRNA maturation endonuclease (ribonuclease M5)
MQLRRRTPDAHTNLNKQTNTQDAESNGSRGNTNKLIESIAIQEKTDHVIILQDGKRIA